MTHCHQCPQHISHIPCVGLLLGLCHMQGLQEPDCQSMYYAWHSIIRILKLSVADDHNTLLISWVPMSASNTCKLWTQRWNNGFSLLLTSAWPLKLGLCGSPAQTCIAAVMIAE